MSNPIPIIEDAFESDLSPELMAKVRQKNPTFYEELYAKVKDFEGARDNSIRERRKGELRPYFPANRDKAYLSGYTEHFGLWEKSYTRPEDLWVFVDKLKERLLYCHSVVLDDPLWLHVDALSVYSKQSNDESFLRRVDHFVAYLMFLQYFRPLIEDGTIVLLSLRTTMSVSGDVPSTTGDDPVKRTLEQIGTQRILGQASARSEDDELLAELIISSSYEALSSVDKLDKRIPGGVDYFLPLAYWETVFRNYCAIKSEIWDGEIPIESLTLQRILHIQLPGIANIRPSDLVSIRTSEEAFEDWRRSLRELVIKMSAYTAEYPVTESGVRQLVTDHLEEKIRALDQTMKSKALRSIASDTLCNFIIGAAATLAVVGGARGIDAAAIGLATAGVKGCIDMMFKYRGTREYEKALMQHYISIGRGS